QHKGNFNQYFPSKTRTNPHVRLQ
ncbi:unnamed protein product, partial [Allacma fusca]